jgi:cytochrome b
MRTDAASGRGRHMPPFAVGPGGADHTLGLLVLRLVWGLAGPPEVRFRAFPPSPAAAVAHLRGLLQGRAPAHRSHNPAGALMAYAFWAEILAVVATGLVTTGITPFGRDGADGCRGAG